MTGLEDRQSLAGDVQQAHRSGARLSRDCQTAGIDVRTLQRWKRDEGGSDRRPLAVRPAPAHALTDAEREEVLRVANSAPFADMPPVRIVPMLADAGRYIASEPSFSRILRAHGQSGPRGRARAPRRVRPAGTHEASVLALLTSAAFDSHRESSCAGSRVPLSVGLSSVVRPNKPFKTAAASKPSEAVRTTASGQ